MKTTISIITAARLCISLSGHSHKDAGGMLSGKAIFEEKHDAIIAVSKSIELYGQYFDHKNWGSLK